MKKLTLSKRVTFIVGLAALIFSCSKDSPIDTTKSHSGCYPRIISAEDGEVTTFTFDNNDHLSGMALDYGSITDNYSVTTNAAGSITKILLIGTRTPVSFRKRINIYNANNLLVTDTLYTRPDSVTVVYNYTYNSSQQATLMQQIEYWPYYFGGTVGFYSYFNYTYPNTTTKNPSQIIVLDGDSRGPGTTVNQTINLTFDTHPNYATVYHGQVDNYFTFSPNNLTTVTATFVNYVDTETNVYAYDDATGYPTSVASTFDTHSVHTVYTYNCK